jgi:hypothetical protein
LSPGHFFRFWPETAVSECLQALLLGAKRTFSQPTENDGTGSIADVADPPHETVALTARRANHLRFIRIVSIPFCKNISLPFFGIL